MKFGLSRIGIIIFILPMIINIFFAIFPPANAPAETAKANRIIEAVEQITRILYMIVICLFVSQQKVDYKSVWLYLGILFLVLYYIVWIRYFVNGRDCQFLSQSFLFIPIPLAVFPVLYFICAAMWVHNIPAVIIMLIFGVSHYIVSYSTLY